jgi:hypothetical protein
VTELGGDPSLVTLSDDVVVLRPWTGSEATFLADASRDPAIERYNGPVPQSLADAVAVIEGFERNWQTFAISGNPTGRLRDRRCRFRRAGRDVRRR